MTKLKRFLLFVSAPLTLAAIAMFWPAARDDAHAKENIDVGSADAKAHPTYAKAKLAAVESYWEAMQATQRGGYDADADENFHLWSCRLLEAERSLADTPQKAVAAALSHWQRMERAYRKVSALFKLGAKGGELEKLAAAKYYRAEAELWLVAAGGAVPKDRLE